MSYEGVLGSAETGLARVLDFLGISTAPLVLQGAAGVCRDGLDHDMGRAPRLDGSDRIVDEAVVEALVAAQRREEVTNVHGQTKLPGPERARTHGYTRREDASWGILNS